MPARLVQVTLINNSDYPIIWQDDGRPHGFWQEPWYPSNIKNLKKGEQGSWRLESGGGATGVEGWAAFKVDVPYGRTEFFNLWWERPYIGHFASKVTYDSPHPGPRLAYVKDHGFGTMTGFDSSPFEFIPALVGPPYTSILFLINDANAKHVSWIVEVLNAREDTVLPGFPTTAPSRQQMAMQSFRHRIEIAPSAGFMGGFPNFYEATYGRNHVGGTIFVTKEAAEWRDVPLAELGNVALEDFGERMRATNTWASQHGFVGGFPTFFHADYGTGIVCGTVLIKSDGAEWRDVPLSELGNPALDDFETRFRATQDYASRHGFVGGFPTLHHAEAVVEVDWSTGRTRRATVCGTVLLKQGEVDIRIGLRHTFAERRDVLLFQGPA